jgi:NADPH:quinone reductase-like Zn-dependent oxidoreductase
MQRRRDHLSVRKAKRDQEIAMNRMQAALLEQVEKPLHISEIDRPVARHGEVLVRVKASGVNPLDLKIREGKAAHARHPLPAILGIDLAGVVEEIGPGVTGFRRGDAVYGMTGGVGGVPGSLAAFAAVDARLLAIKPSKLSMRQAAALPLIFITAWEGLIHGTDLASERTVLVLGGSGGVGHMAIQIAVASGAKVFATASASKADFIRGLGATPIDRAQPVEAFVQEHTQGKGFEVVYDTVGGEALDQAFHSVAKFGHVVSCLGWGTHALAPLSFKAAHYAGVFTLLPLLTGEGREHHGAILREATRLAEAGKLIPHVDPREFALDQAEQAHELVRTRGNDGKVVVTVG